MRIALIDNKTLVPGTVIFYTTCKTGMGRMPKALLAEIGITGAMYDKAPTLLSEALRDHAWLGFFGNHGVEDVIEITVAISHGGRARHGMFAAPRPVQTIAKN